MSANDACRCRSALILAMGVLLTVSRLGPFPVRAQTPAPSPKPVAVYLAGPSVQEYSVRTVVYDNGLVVFDDDPVRQDHAGLIVGDAVRVRSVYQSSQLSPTALQKLIGQMYIDRLSRLSSQYEMSGPWVYKLVTWSAGHKHESEASGFLYREGADPDDQKINYDVMGRLGDAQEQARKAIPTDLLDAFDALQYYYDAKSTVFIGTQYSLQFQQAGKNVSKGRPWPPELAALDMTPDVDPEMVYSTPCDRKTYEAITDEEFKSGNDRYVNGAVIWEIVPTAIADLPNHEMWDDELTDAMPQPAQSPPHR